MHIWDTHEIHNQVDELQDYALLGDDPALHAALLRNGAQTWLPQLQAYGRQLGQGITWKLADQANAHGPVLQRFDARGRLCEDLIFHPAWHALMALYRQQGLVSMPFDSALPGRWSAWAAGFYLHSQVEQGTMCPATMTTAAIPLLRKEPALWAQLEAGLFSRRYDERDLPADRKVSLWIGMGMTEKQGGSDVRANTTRARPAGDGGRGGEYLLRGHKWFYSAPTSDAHLVVAQVDPDGGPACFWVPRWRPDGTRNAIRIQRLKDKLGNRSNASSEVEFQDAYGVLMGDAGRGIPTIIEMATMTRLNCVLGSSAILRTATVQALAYARKRKAFGKVLVAHPLMRSVLVDLALESEAALTLSMRLAQAFELEEQPLHRAWKRILTPAAKFWVCKRTVALTAEAMEVMGGNGYVETSVMARLLREAPVNSIWEGSGNIMCLDVLRAMARDPETASLLLQDLAQQAGEDAALKRTLQHLVQALQLPAAQQEAQARQWVQQLVLLAQACLLRSHAPQAVAEAFVQSRLGLGAAGWVAGAIDIHNMDVDAILQRALPV
ncbi:acyl-CoA dehydrogenase family protein [Comamonas sp. NoAH]|uniref:acyl-CoA dehydrogenase family protein n=1 Tax=Comamonas halotolerans TaxID=3041496 RepID=UPI0024E072F3|nr:acyl-CoA dehydrogenase family protein [Comamonas sp. NoAH]